VRLALSLALSLVAMAAASVVTHRTGLVDAHIEVVAAFIAYFCMSLDTLPAAVGSFSVGWFFDVMTGYPTGLYPLVAMLTFVVCRVVVAMVDVRSAASFGLLVVLTDAFHQLFAAAVVDLFSGRANPPTQPMLAAIPLTALLTGLSAVILFPAFHRLDLSFGREESSLLR
jgi:hypothetical protein